MVTARAEHTATLLPNGKVLVAGGIASNNESEVLASAELYDPATGRWSATGSMVTPRAQHTATLLLSGKVLVAGGHCDGRATKGCPKQEEPDGAMSAAEVYDPATGVWTATGSMTTERFLHTATLLADGRVLVAGAEHAPDSILDSAELYDPRTGKWTSTGSMRNARTQQTDALLRDGRVLVAGGVGPVSATAHGPLASAELYDPRAGTWTATGGMKAARAPAPLAVLRDGTVLMTGGDPGTPEAESSEIYDPNTGTWSASGHMVMGRAGETSTTLADGTVLDVGGFDVDGLIALAELYDPSTGVWSGAGSLTVPRFAHTATLLEDGKVLVVGGLIADNGIASSAELYDPSGGN